MYTYTARYTQVVLSRTSCAVLTTSRLCAVCTVHICSQVHSRISACILSHIDTHLYSYTSIHTFVSSRVGTCICGRRAHFCADDPAYAARPNIPRSEIGVYDKGKQEQRIGIGKQVTGCCILRVDDESSYMYAEIPIKAYHALHVCICILQIVKLL